MKYQYLNNKPFLLKYRKLKKRRNPSGSEIIFLREHEPKMVNEISSFCMALLYKYFKSYFGSYGKDNLISYAYDGFCDAIVKWMPEKHVKFTTYATIRAKGAVYDGMRTESPYPRFLIKGKEQMLELTEKYFDKNKKPIPDRVLMIEMNIKEETLKTIKRFVHASNEIHLDEYVQGDSEEVGISNYDIVPSNDYTPEKIARGNIRIEKTIKAMESLPEKLGFVLYMYYFKFKTLKEIGKIMNFSESMASQLRAQGLKLFKSRYKRYYDCRYFDVGDVLKYNNDKISERD